MSENIFNRYNAIFPNDWKKEELRKLGKFYGGLISKTKSDFEKGNSKFITYRNINKNTFINPNDLAYVLIKEGENQNNVRPGDILFTGSSETPDEAGMSSVMLEDLQDVYLNSFCFGFRFDKQDQLYPNFYAYYFRSDIFRKTIFPLAQGSTRYNLAKSELAKVSVAIPPTAEQYRIASILTSLDNAIKKTESIIEQTEKVKKGLMQQLLTKGIGHTKFKKTEIGEIPEEWEVKQLDEICLKIFVGIATSTTNSYTSEGVIIIRNQNIHEDYLDTSNLLQITEEFSEKNKTKKLEEGDVLTVRTGYPGISCVVPKHLEGSHTFTTLVSRPNKKIINPYFLSRYINSEHGKKFVVGGKAGGAQQNLNVATLKRLPVPVPTLKEQAEIINIIQSVDEKIISENKKIQQLTSIKNGLMQVLLTGKVRVKVDEEEVTTS